MIADACLDVRMVAHQVADRVGVEQRCRHQPFSRLPGSLGNNTGGDDGRRPSAMSRSNSSTHSAGTLGELSMAARMAAGEPGTPATGVTRTSVPSVNGDSLS